MLAVAPNVGHDVLETGWQQRVPDRLEQLAKAWSQTDQDESMTKVGGVDLPRFIAVRVALQELVLHGWDLAAAIGRSFQVDQASLDTVHDMVVSTPTSGPERDGLFGPVVDVPAEAPLLDRTVGLAGRQPDWPAQRR